MIEPYPDVFAEFVESARHGVKRIATVSDAGNNEGITLVDTVPLRIEATRAFDFGFLRDLSTGRALDLDVYNNLSEQGEELLNAGKFRLPFPECWFVIWFSDAGGARYDTVNLLHAIETDSGGLHVVTYFGCIGAPGDLAKWTQASIQSVWEPDLDGWIAVTETRFTSDHWYSERKADAEVMLNNVLVASLLLAQQPDPPQAKQTDYLARVNRGRERGNLRPLPAVRLIDLTKFTHSADSTGTGGRPLRPHDRRGHYRTLQTGRIVPVRPPKYTAEVTCPRITRSAGNDRSHRGFGQVLEVGSR